MTDWTIFTMSASEAALAHNSVMMPEIPKVTEEAALDDRSWFAGRPDRRFRARVDDGGVWFVRRRGEVLLRTFAPRLHRVPEDDRQIAPAWFTAAYPHWPAETIKKAAREALGKARKA
jgi:hypothetical protein